MQGIPETNRKPPDNLAAQHRSSPQKLRPRREGFAIGFADEISLLRDRLNIEAGEIEIPNGNEWLAREIYEFTQTFVDILFAFGEMRSLGFWRDDLILGMKEAIANSIVHAVWAGENLGAVEEG